MNYKVKFLLPFKDGNIFTNSFALNEVANVTERELAMLRQSGAKLEVLGQVVPPHIPAVPENKVPLEIGKEYILPDETAAEIVAGDKPKKKKRASE